MEAATPTAIVTAIATIVSVKVLKLWCEGCISFIGESWKVNQTDSKLRITCCLRADVIEKN